MNSDAWNQRYSDGRADWPEGPVEALMEMERNLSPGTALDLACGTGRNAIFLARRGWTVTAVDFSDRALEVARRRAAEENVHVHWLLQDLERWTPPRAVWDLVLICYLHVPWPQFKLILQNAERALRPEGTLFVLGHDRANITEGTGKPKHDDVVYTAGDVASELRKSTVLYADREHRTPDHGATDRPDTLQIDCLVHARRRVE